MPKTRTVWLRDCSTPQAAPAGRFVSAGALVFLRATQIQSISDPNCHRAAALIRVAMHGQARPSLAES
jgi:hypothetical protein